MKPLIRSVIVNASGNAWTLSASMDKTNWELGVNVLI